MSKYLQEFAVQRAKAILDFWFGKTEEQLLYYDLCEDRQPMWFRGGDEVDKEIREKFGQDLPLSSYGISSQETCFVKTQKPSLGMPKHSRFQNNLFLLL
ncbi:hypothetical protein Gasu2_47270 [Galdieria sulphuraria]|nr:hypothetical protein Gasu2_47270 [Galdieria sulphuraria]